MSVSRSVGVHAGVRGCFVQPFRCWVEGCRKSLGNALRLDFHTKGIVKNTDLDA